MSLSFPSIAYMIQDESLLPWQNKHAAWERHYDKIKLSGSWKPRVTLRAGFWFLWIFNPQNGSIFFFVQIVHPGLMTIEQSGRHYTWDRIRRSWVQSVSRTTHPSHKSTQLTDNLCDELATHLEGQQNSRLFWKFDHETQTAFLCGEAHPTDREKNHSSCCSKSIFPRLFLCWPVFSKPIAFILSSGMF